MKWVKLGCTLMNTLTSTPEGVRYLENDDQLLSQLVKAFAQLDPVRCLLSLSLYGRIADVWVVQWGVGIGSYFLEAPCC